MLKDQRSTPSCLRRPVCYHTQMKPKVDVTVWECPCYQKHRLCETIEVLQKQIKECSCACHQAKKVYFRVYGTGPSGIKLYFDERDTPDSEATI